VTAILSRSDLEAQGRAIVEARGGKWDARRGGMCRCPAHDDADPSLSVRVGDTSLLFHCFAGCTAVDVIQALRRSGDHVSSIDPATASSSERPVSIDLQPIAERLWREGRGVGRTLAADYLASRHIASHSAQLRFNGRVQLGRGRAKFDNPKRLLANPGRGTVRIGQPARVLGLAEGVETALAASVIHGFPVWAVLGNERFGLVTIPRCVERLIVLADNDTGGARAAKLANDGLQRDRLTIETLWPPAQHNDWSDVLMAMRGEGAAPD